MALSRFRRAAASAWMGTAQRVRHADWQSIAAEIALIVFGILIAFQLDRWAERWSQRDEQHRVLVRIAEETGRDIGALADIRDEHLASAKSIELAVLAMDNPEPRAALARRASGGCDMLRLPAVRLSGGDYGEMVAADRLSLLPDARLRELLREAAAERRFNDGQLAYFRAAFQRYTGIVEPYMAWSLAPSNAESCRIDLDGLERDGLARATLPKLHRDQLRFADYRARELAAERAVRQRARCLIAEEC